MTSVHPHSLGRAFGIFMGLFHAFWSLLIFFGVAQWLLDLIFRLHMIAPVYTIAPFSLAKAIGLVAVTTTIGYIFGWFLGIIWNRYAVR